MVLVEQDGLKITLNGEQSTETIEDGKFQLRMIVENETKQDIEVLFYPVVNGLNLGDELNVFSLAYVSANELAMIDLELWQPYNPGITQDMINELNTFSDVETIEFVFFVNMWGGGKTLFEADSGLIHFGENTVESTTDTIVSENTVEESAAEEKIFIPGQKLILLDRDDVKLTCNGSYNLLDGGTELWLIAENHGEAVSITYRMSDSQTGRVLGEQLSGIFDGLFLYYEKNLTASEAGEIIFEVRKADNQSLMFEETVILDYYTNQENSSVEERSFIPGQESVLFEQDGVKTWCTGKYDERGNTNIYMVLENNSDKSISASFRRSTSFTNYGIGPMRMEPGYRHEFSVAYGKPYAELDADAFIFDIDEVYGEYSGEDWSEVNTGVIRFEEAYETLEVGSRGENVKTLQKKLIELGHLIGSSDGIYGNGTAAGVKSFQSAEGLEQTGVADSETQVKLFSK